jgi:hypothetical protein
MKKNYSFRSKSFVATKLEMLAHPQIHSQKNVVPSKSIAKNVVVGGLLCSPKRKKKRKEKKKGGPFFFTPLHDFSLVAWKFSILNFGPSLFFGPDK